MKIHKSNSGFTLVEILVCITIISILGIGVTTAISHYINKSKIRTDLYNADALQTELTIALANCDITDEYNEYFLPDTERPEINNGNLVIMYHWIDEAQLNKIGNSYYFYDKNKTSLVKADWGAYNERKIDGKTKAGTELLKYLYNNSNLRTLPKCQSGGEFWMFIYFDEDGNYKDHSVVVASPLGDNRKIKYREEYNCYRVSSTSTYAIAYQPEY